MCRVVNDRLLCGYNKNSGRLNNHDSYVELSGGCRLRNGRLECGYVHPPFTNPRRPPPLWDPQASDAGYNEPENTYPNDDDHDDNDERSQPQQTANEQDKLKKKNTQSLQKSKNVEKLPAKDVKCVEINDRIVCKNK